jgi:hypothetical protein
MATNTGFLLMAGLGALLFLGRGGATTKTTDEDNRLLVAPGRAGPMPLGLPAFDLQSYVDQLFRDTTTVPKQPPMTGFFPRAVVVTSSGVPGVARPAAELITPTTKVEIGGAGGETITASALAVLRSEQLAKQRFDAAANVQPRTWAATVEANRVEEMRQMVEAQRLIAAARSRQVATKAIAELRSRNAQEAAARAVNPVKDSYQAAIIIDDYGWMSTDTAVRTTATAGQDIVSDDPQGTPTINVDFTPQYSETFVISGGMDTPAYFGEEEDYQPTTVHEVTAAYDIGF